MSLISRGQRALVQRQRRAASPPGTLYYRPPAGGLVDLTGKAWVGRTRFTRLATDNAHAAAVVWGDRDYLIPVDALLNGGPITPARGGRFEETIDGTTLTFEVMPPATGEPEWRYSDPGRTLYRVHVKQVVTT